MFSQDIVYGGAGVDVPLNQGGVTLQAATGFRVIPVLALGGSGSQMQAAYAGLTATVKKQSVNFNPGVDEIHKIPGADWIRSPGFGALTLTGGVNGVTYRVWIATDCKEMKDAVIPSMYGFANGDAGTSGGTLTATNQTQNFTAAAPTVVGDGADITAAKAVKVSVRPATAAAILTAVGVLKCYSWSTNLARWVRVPELDFPIVEAVTEPMPIGTGAMVIPIGVGRVQWTPSAMAASAGTQVVTSIEVLT